MPGWFARSNAISRGFSFMRNLNRVAIVAVATGVAWAGTIATSSAAEVVCVPSNGSPAVPAQAGITHEVTVVDVAAQAAVPAVTHDETVIDVQGSAFVPAVTHDVVTKVIDITGVPAVPAVTVNIPVIDIPAIPAVPGVTAVAEVSHTEYRFQSRVALFGSKEIKSVTGYDFVDGGTTNVDGHTVAGHWVVSAGVHQIPDVIINIVWGPGGVPAQYLGTGSVNLSTYGGPNKTVVYTAVKVATDAGYTDFGPWSDWSTTAVTASTLVNVDTKKVVDVAAVIGFPGTPAIPAVTHITTVVLIPGIPATDEVSHLVTTVVTDVPAIAAVEEISHVVTVVDVPGVEAVSEVSHTELVVDVPPVDAVPAVPAVLCPVVPPVVVVPPIVTPPVVTPPKHSKPPVLPQTGANTSSDWAIAGAGLFVIAAGATCIIFTARRQPKHAK